MELQIQENHSFDNSDDGSVFVEAESQLDKDLKFVNAKYGTKKFSYARFTPDNCWNGETVKICEIKPNLTKMLKDFAN